MKPESHFQPYVSLPVYPLHHSKRLQKHNILLSKIMRNNWKNNQISYQSDYLKYKSYLLNSLRISSLLAVTPFAQRFSTIDNFSVITLTTNIWDTGTITRCITISIANVILVRCARQSVIITVIMCQFVSLARSRSLSRSSWFHQLSNPPSRFFRQFLHHHYVTIKYTKLITHT